MTCTSYRLVVRTLDFHSNNAGSNPAGSSMNNRILSQTKSSYFIAKLSYEFFFVSLLPLVYLGSDKLRYSQLHPTLCNKLFIKKSYLILLWLHYLASYKKDKYTVKISTINARTKLYTVVKAPMAHKTNSKEQFTSRYYRFKVKFEVKRHYRNSLLSTKSNVCLNTSFYKMFPTFETNLLFLTSSKVLVPLVPKSFFFL